MPPLDGMLESNDVAGISKTITSKLRSLGAYRASPVLQLLERDVTF